jgi:hypothetical protein
MFEFKMYFNYKPICASDLSVSLAVVIESHELMNKSHQSVINYSWKNDLMQLKATANNFNAESLYKSFQ